MWAIPGNVKRNAEGAAANGSIDLLDGGTQGALIPYIDGNIAIAITQIPVTSVAC